MGGCDDSGSGLGVLLGLVGLVGLAYYLGRKKCPKCQHENAPEATHCCNCGGKL